MLLLITKNLPAAGRDQTLAGVTPAQVDFPAPDLALRDTSGVLRDLKDYRGQVLLVNLWATWCPPCRKEMPVFEEIFARHRDRGFTIVAINDGESAEVVGRFVSNLGLSFPVWLDPTYRASEVAFRAATLPTSYVIDRSGQVRLVWIGAIDAATLEAHLMPIMEE